MNPALKFKAVIGTLVLLIIGYSGLWYTSAFKAQKDMTATLSMWRDSGLVVEHKSVELSGFPYRFVLTIPDVLVGTREDGLIFDSQSVTLISHLWTPDHWIAEATNTRISLASGAAVFEEGFMQASYRIHGGDKLVIKVDSAGSNDFNWINKTNLPEPDAWTLLLGFDESETESKSGLYEKRTLEFKFYGEKNGDTIDVTGGISGPPVRDWTPSQLAVWRDEGGLLAIDNLVWQAANMNLKMNGDITLDEIFRPLGSASVVINDWDTFTKLAPRIGLLPEEIAPDQTSLTLQNGLIQLGDQTIGRATPLFK
ncbi:DUF2125 domain-containing protein [Kordiimonas aquimaris]|uniref:DUF2125 domain-containing protein n=1 Tax=Kordiimonas aquimaris TaxID=707591 RepID=UPI0021D2A213|nr:DUF2125 domain-containing protein [Kordiimonas aquimaris]